MNIKQDYITAGRKNRPGYKMTPAFITIHDTGNINKGAGAANHATYLKGDAAANAPVSWHFTVDDNIIIQHLPLNESGWHAGDGGSGPGNRTSVGVEICENSDGNRSKAEANAALLVAWLLGELNLDISKVVQHNKWSGKNCPRVLRSRPNGWTNFLKEVESHMASKAFTAEIIDQSGVTHPAPADSVRIESGVTWIKARTFTDLVGGVVGYDKDANKSTFDFSKFKPPEVKYPLHERRNNCDVITAKPEQLKVALIKGKLSSDGINGGYMDSSLNPLGIVVIDGKILADRVSYRPPRATFVINDGKASIVKAESASKLGAVQFALGAGPNLLPAVANDEDFQADVFSSSRPRSAIGITSDGVVKLAATDAMTLQQLSSLMRDLGCVQAVNLDGGGSSQLRFGGKMIRSGDGRSLSTAILLV